MERARIINQTIILFKHLKTKCLEFPQRLTCIGEAKQEQEIGELTQMVAQQIQDLPYSEYSLVEIDLWLKELEKENKVVKSEAEAFEAIRKQVNNGIIRTLIEVKIKLLEKEFVVDDLEEVENEPEVADDGELTYDDYLTMIHYFIKVGIFKDKEFLGSMARQLAGRFSKEYEQVLIEIYKLKTKNSCNDLPSRSIEKIFNIINELKESMQNDMK